MLIVFARQLSDRALARIRERNARSSPWLRPNPWDFSVLAFRLRGAASVFVGIILISVGITLKP
jgi:hypothetical protein